MKRLLTLKFWTHFLARFFTKFWPTFCHRKIHFLTGRHQAKNRRFLALFWPEKWLSLPTPCDFQKIAMRHHFDQDFFTWFLLQFFLMIGLLKPGGQQSSFYATFHHPWCAFLALINLGVRFYIPKYRFRKLQLINMPSVGGWLLPVCVFLALFFLDVWFLPSKKQGRNRLCTCF